MLVVGERNATGGGDERKFEDFFIEESGRNGEERASEGENNGLFTLIGLFEDSAELIEILRCSARNKSGVREEIEFVNNGFNDELSKLELKLIGEASKETSGVEPPPLFGNGNKVEEARDRGGEKRIFVEDS